MKTNILFPVAILLLLLTGNASSQKVADKSTTLQKGSATITCTPGLDGLATKWASEYNRLNPDKYIKVVCVPDNNKDLGTAENLSFITNKSLAAINNQKNWKMVVGRDVIIPVVNAQNPFINELLKRGVSPSQFAMALNHPAKLEWGTLLANAQHDPVHVYIMDDESVNSGGKIPGTVQIPVNGITVATKDEVVSAIQTDPFALGFCKVVNIMVPESQNLVGNVRLLPVDKNGNGTIDYMEDIYTDANTFLRGIWIGKYPKTLYSNIYAIRNEAPANETELSFLSWVLADGQQYMNTNGFCELERSESQTQLAKLNTAVISVAPVDDASQTGIILLIISLLITTGIIVSVVIRSYSKQEKAIPDFSLQPGSFDENAVELPQGLYFNKSHTWAFMEKNGNISIGIDDFLQHITGPITRVEMKNPGEKIKKGDLLFSIIQAGKQLSLYSPVSGTIIKQNEMLIEDPSLMNSSPYADGWVYMIESKNWYKEFLLMEMAEKYKRWIDNEFSRVKDFLAAKVKPESIEYSHLVLQDGGVLKEGVLSDFGPEVWEDFQANFLENYK